MNERVRRMFNSLISNFGKPKFDLGSDDKIREADETLEKSEQKRKELELRYRLLEIQATPRGNPNE